MATDMEVANRLIALREKLQQDQKTFAESLGIEKNTYNAYERGKRPLTIESAKKIRKKYGISTDWLLYGDLGQPNHGFIMQIEAERAPAAKREPAKPAKKKRAAA
jgi:transcriptional regulator with XRE-family HTH domain